MAQREIKDCRDRGVSQEKQGASEEMAPWEILGILDEGETLGHLDQKVTMEDQDSTIPDGEDPLETEVIQVEEDPGGAEVNVVPKDKLEITDNQERLGQRVSRVSQEGEEQEEILDLTGTQDQWAILGSMTAMS